MPKRILAGLLAVLAIAAAGVAEAKRPLVGKARAVALLTEDPAIARNSGLSRNVLQCLARPRGDLPSVLDDMFDPQLGDDIYGDVQPNLAVISYTDHILRFPPGRMLEEMRSLERDRSGLRATLEDPRLKSAYGLIGDIGNVLQPSALGLLDMLGKKTLAALHKRLESGSLNLVFDAYRQAYRETGDEGSAWRRVDDWQFNTASRAAQDLRYGWRTAAAQMQRVSDGLRMGVPGDALLRRVVVEAHRRRAGYVNVDVILDGIVRSQMWQAKMDAARAIARHPGVYRCVENPNYRPTPYVDNDSHSGGGGSGGSQALKNCLCGCLQGNTEFSCSWNTEAKGTSPSCRNPANGPCICQAFGCFRKQPPQSGECHRECLRKHGS